MPWPVAAGRAATFVHAGRAQPRAREMGLPVSSDVEPALDHTADAKVVVQVTGHGAPGGVSSMATARLSRASSRTGR